MGIDIAFVQACVQAVYWVEFLKLLSNIMQIFLTITQIYLKPINGAWKKAFATDLEAIAELSVMRYLPSFDDLMWATSHVDEIISRERSTFNRYMSVQTFFKKIWYIVDLFFLRRLMMICLVLLSPFALLARILNINFVYQNDWDLRNALLYIAFLNQVSSIVDKKRERKSAQLHLLCSGADGRADEREFRLSGYIQYKIIAQYVNKHFPGISGVAYWATLKEDWFESFFKADLTTVTPT